MAKQKGYIKLKGSLGGLTFYDKDGENIVRTTNGVDKARILNDPAFKRTRENMSEFGASAQIAKLLRQGFANVVKSMGDNSLVGRVTGMMKKVNAAGPGERGQRAFEIVNSKALLEGFEFSKKSPLRAVFYAPYTAPELDANRSEAVWEVPDFNTDSFINAPEGASHFKLVLATAVLSDYVYDAGSKAYAFVNPEENGVGGVAFSDEIPLGGAVGTDTELTVTLDFAAALPATVGVISAVGIVFYQEINAQFYELSTDNAMRIEVVG